jgi:hypothetical protein
VRAIFNTAVDDGRIKRDRCRIKGARAVSERRFACCTRRYAGATSAGWQMLTTVVDNLQRMRSKTASAHLCGVAPIPAKRR